MDIRKRRANLYRHIHRLPTIRPSHQTHNTTSTLNDTTNWVIEHRIDLQKSYRKLGEISDKHTFGNGTHSDTQTGSGTQSI